MNIESWKAKNEERIPKPKLKNQGEEGEWVLGVCSERSSLQSTTVGNSITGEAAKERTCVWIWGEWR